MFLFGLLAWLLLLASVLVFSMGFTEGFHLNGDFYGSTDVFTWNEMSQNFHWGPHLGWYTSVATLVIMLPGILFGITMRGARDKRMITIRGDGRVVVEHVTRPTYNTMSIPHSVESI